MTFLAPGARFEFSLQDRAYVGQFMSCQMVGKEEFLKIKVAGHETLINPAHIATIIKESARDMIIEDMTAEISDDFED